MPKCPNCKIEKEINEFAIRKDRKKGNKFISQ